MKHSPVVSVCLVYYLYWFFLLIWGFIVCKELFIRVLTKYLFLLLWVDVTLHYKLDSNMGQGDIWRNYHHLKAVEGRHCCSCRLDFKVSEGEDAACAELCCRTRVTSPSLLEQMLSEANEVNCAYPHVTPCTCKYFIHTQLVTDCCSSTVWFKSHKGS